MDRHTVRRGPYRHGPEALHTVRAGREHRALPSGVDIRPSAAAFREGTALHRTDRGLWGTAVAVVAAAVAAAVVAAAEPRRRP